MKTLVSLRSPILKGAFALLLPVWMAASDISPTTPLVTAGESLKLTTRRHVTWKLAPGSIGSIDADGTYHAPKSIPVPKSLAGCQIGALDSVFNTRIDRLPVHTKSAAWIGALPPAHVSIDPSWGITVTDNTTPSLKLSFAYTPPYNDQLFQLPQWPNVKRESGIFSDPLAENDRHIISVNHQTCQIYEIYNNYAPGTQPQEKGLTAQSGWQYNSMSYDLPSAGSTSASGMPLVPGTLNLDDIRAGAIRHVVLVTFGNAYINPSFIWPATTNAGAWGKNAPPYGTRLRLKNSFDTSSFSKTAQILLTALKEYGMIISDGGSNWDIITSTDLTEDRTVQAASAEILEKRALLNKNEFEVVDESSLMVKPNSTQIAGGSQYATPPAFAVAIADDGSSHPASVAITLQGVAINGPEGGGIWIQSGVSKKPKVLVGGTSNTSLTWTMSPTLGILDRDSGIYTAPPVNSPATTEITVHSLADPSASLTFPLTVLPAGPIRIVAGDATHNPQAPNKHAPDYGPDSQNHMWWHDQAVERSWGVKNDYWYPASRWPSTPDIGLYQTQYYNLGDTVYRFVVPNGTYRIDYYVAQGDCASGTIAPDQYREHLESQGQIILHDYRPLAQTFGNCYTPIHTAIPAIVSDNDLYFALRRITDHTQKGPAPVTILSAFSITPVNEKPHLTIDPSNFAPLTMSQSVQLYAVGWFMPGKVQWHLLSGQGSITDSGLYQAPASPTKGTATILATSSVDSSQTAKVTIPLSFGDVSIAPAQFLLNRSGTQQFTAKIGSQPYANVAWSLTPNIGSISGTGKYSAPDDMGKDAAVQISAKSLDDPSKIATAALTIKAAPDPIRINCGDNGEVVDAQGHVWGPDYAFTTPSIAYSQDVAIAGAPPELQRLYQSARYSGYDNHNFAYEFPLPDGPYRLTLKFADYGNNQRGHFLFDVKVNGSKVLSHFDPVVAAGSRQAIDKTFAVQVTGKILHIDFIGGANYSIINGIEIIPISASASH